MMKRETEAETKAALETMFNKSTNEELTQEGIASLARQTGIPGLKTTSGYSCPNEDCFTWATSSIKEAKKHFRKCFPDETNLNDKIEANATAVQKFPQKNVLFPITLPKHTSSKSEDGEDDEGSSDVTDILLDCSMEILFPRPDKVESAADIFDEVVKNEFYNLCHYSFWTEKLKHKHLRSSMMYA